MKYEIFQNIYTLLGKKCFGMVYSRKRRQDASAYTSHVLLSILSKMSEILEIDFCFFDVILSSKSVDVEVL